MLREDEMFRSAYARKLWEIGLQFLQDDVPPEERVFRVEGTEREAAAWYCGFRDAKKKVLALKSKTLEREGKSFRTDIMQTIGITCTVRKVGAAVELDWRPKRMQPGQVKKLETWWEPKEG